MRSVSVNYLRHSGLRTIRGGIRFGLDLLRLALPKHRELGYQRIATSWGLIVNLPVFAVPNIIKSLFACLLVISIVLSAKKDTSLTCLICRIMGRLPTQLADYSTPPCVFFQPAGCKLIVRISTLLKNHLPASFVKFASSLKIIIFWYS
jgi:hypothetical protein